MPYLERNIEKVYYSIGEVASILEVATSKIRYWEKFEFEWLSPKLNKNGVRQYTRSEVKELVNIKFLIDNGMSLEGVRLAKKYDYFDELIGFFMDYNFNYGVRQAEKL
jgi:DNA-binding transcriptional MerR regulator